MICGGNIGKTDYTAEDLITAIKSRFNDNNVLRNIALLDGHQHLNSEQPPPRVVFVVGNGEIRFGSVRGEPGAIGTFVDVIEAHIWGCDGDKDYGQDQMLAAKAIAIELATAVYLDVSAMATGDAIEVASNTHVLKYGESIVMSIRLRCPIYVVNQSVTRHYGGATNGV